MSAVFSVLTQGEATLLLTLCWSSEAVAQPRPHEEPQEGVPLSVWAAVMESALMVEHLGCFWVFFAISNKALLTTLN